jgi:MoxR-like ATPase
MSDALRRRCLHLYIDYPERDLELEVVRLKVPAIESTLAGRVVDAMGRIRKLNLKKKPSISETLDWARALLALQVENLSAEVVADTLNVICKHRGDAESVRGRLPDIVK